MDQEQDAEAARGRRRGITRRERGERLKESIYLIFAALAVTLSQLGHGHVEAGAALLTLFVTMLGTVLAVFTADLIAHFMVHERLTTWAELRHAIRVTFGALPSVAIPFLLLGISALTGWSVESALIASGIALAGALAAVTWAAVRKVRQTWWQGLLLLGIETVLALAVLGLQLLAHS